MGKKKKKAKSGSWSPLIIGVVILAILALINFLPTEKKNHFLPKNAQINEEIKPEDRKDLENILEKVNPE